MTSLLAPIVGIIGGVGSGKSTLARELMRHWRVQLVNADAAGHAALEAPAVQQALREAFGDDVFDAAGRVSRPRLATLVFGDDPQCIAARRRLEAIVHPPIRRQLERDIARARSEGSCDLVVLDAAVMLEAGWSDLCDAIVFVDVPRPVRVERVLRNRGWNDNELARREASQWPLERKRTAADFVVSNAGDVRDAGRELVEFLSRRFAQDLPPPSSTLPLASV
jgi:dephospho-CoA kinase